MKTSFVISSVVAAHCAVIGGALLIQGCGTTRGPVDLPVDPPMPPKVEPQEVVKKPIKQAPPTASIDPEVKTWKNDDITSYVVGKGDTMSGIAHRYGLTVAEIMALNSVATPDKIRIGQKLVLPGKFDVSKPVKSSGTSPVTAPVPAGSNVYVVQSGDCLSVIAHKAGVTTKAIREANNLKGDVIYVGKKLVIPGGKKITVNRNTAAPAPTPIRTAPADEISIPVTPPTIINEDIPLPDLAPELPVSGGEVQYYTVKPGQTILDVVSEFNVSIADLRSANNLPNDILNPGQKLIIPTKE